MAPAEQDLRRFFDTAPVGMYRSTAEGRFVFVNPALVALLGYDRADDVIALDLGRDVYVDPDVRAGLVDRYRDSERAEGVDVKWKTRSGDILTVRLYSRIVRTDAGDIEFDTTVFDVTELHQVREGMAAGRDELQHAATTLGLLLGQIPAILWTTDAELRMTSSGGAVRELLGSTPNRTVGMSLFEYFKTDDADHPVIAYHRQALAGEVVSYDYDWAGRTFTARLGPRRSADGETIGTIGTAIDVTAGRSLERRMVDAQRAESLGVLAGGLAHDFNNLLVAMLGNADLALRDPPGSRDALTNIKLAAMRAAELVQQLLAYAGGGSRQVVDVAIGPLIGELIALLASTTPLDVNLRNELGPDLPPVRADPSQLRQVILNLVTNARDAVIGRPGEDAGAPGSMTRGRGGDVRVSARTVDHDGGVSADDVLSPPAPGRYLVIAVTDDGAGVEPALRARIFDPFFTTKATGHGLGLAAVLGIVRSHAGGLRVAGNPGGGARFEVWWPTSARAEPTRLPTPVPTPVLNVMVVDDEDLVRDVLARMVEDLGYSVISVGDGAEALAVADRAEVTLDVVILDLTMPTMSGRTVLTGLRARRPGVPIVLCSGYDREREAATGPVGDAFLRKPFRMEDLEKILAEVTRKGSFA